MGKVRAYREDQTGDLHNRRNYWIYLNRRDTSEAAYQSSIDRLDEKAKSRRLRAMGELLADNDLPFRPDDLAEIQACGVRIRCLSRWLGAVSIEANSEQLRMVTALPMVERMSPVRRGRAVEANRQFNRIVLGSDSLLYGNAWNQNRMIGVPEAHRLGYTGMGVRVGFLDSGYNFYSSHHAFAFLNVIGVWNALDSSDFIDTGLHGAQALSVMAANDTGRMVGVAPDVEVLLVRTEDNRDEYPAEEDYWVAGLEWAEAAGADLISTSLGYYLWYEPEDFDGETAVTTIAANQAAARGLLVVTSAGNQGDGGIGAPADGDSVLAVGAVTQTGEYAPFSSNGPTYDGRIKPDVAALGEYVAVIGDTSSDAYFFLSGTSFSCPAATGALALLLQADPELLPMELVDLLKTTASQAEAPDTLLGWGIINLPAALKKLGPQAVCTYSPSRKPMIPVVFPNPTNGGIQVEFDPGLPGLVQLSLFNLLGREVLVKHYSLTGKCQTVQLDLQSLPSGIYFLKVTDESQQSAKIILER